MSSPVIIGTEDLAHIPFHLWAMFLYACHLKQGEPISAAQTGKHFNLNWRTVASQLAELVDKGLANREPGPNRAYAYYPSDRWQAKRQDERETQAITRYRLQMASYQRRVMHSL
jgi:hypothetical protein